MSGTDDEKRPTEDLASNSAQEEVIKVAPPTASDQNDRRAVRPRSRRERPRKLRPLVQNGSQDDGTAAEQRFGIIEPDIESFISNCIPGVALLTSEGTLRRTKLIRKRSLPLMSFLSQTTLAAAEKKRKKEEQARQKLLAQEAAKAIVESTTRGISADDAATEEGLKQGDGDVKLPSTPTKDNGVREDGKSELRETLQDNVNTSKPSITTTWEGRSNVLMPPLLVVFMNTLKKQKRHHKQRTTDTP